MIQEFELWSRPRTDTNSLSDLSGSVLAIEADFYLDRLLHSSSAKEPLLSALGGTPFSFQTHVENELTLIQQHDIKPIFVFSGLEVGKNYAPFTHGDAVANTNADAWDLYNRHEATEAVTNFGNSGYATPRRYYRLLQKVLRDLKIEFQVAPYSALGQLAYLARHAPDHVDAVAASSELLLFDVDRIIISFEFDNAEFTFIRKQQCVEELNLLHSDMFTDACLLSGCSLLPALPTLVPARVPKVRQVVDLLKSHGHTGISVCNAVEKSSSVADMDYINRYKRSRLAVKHDVVMTTAGKAEPLAADDIPNDLHDVIGQRLPDELYYYLSVGAVSDRVLNQLTTAHIYENCPADGGESDVYKTLVSERLMSHHALSLALLAQRLHRAYQHRIIELSAWYAPDRQTKINLNEQADPIDTVADWRVPESAFGPVLDFNGPSAVLASAVSSISDLKFASQTKDTKAKLQSTTELKANNLWRFLHLRGYIDDKHTLASWGKVLATMIDALPAGSEQVESVFLATELLKLDLLSSENMFPRYTGAPMHGSENDKANTLLLARIACLTTLNHKSIGFTGPLSRHLLGYSCLVDVVRTNIRDLLEICLVSMLLAGHATKERADLTQIALDLPFLLPLDCALGVAMKHYLDDVAASAPSGLITAEIRDQAKDRGVADLFPHVKDLRKDLDKGFQLWDAVSEYNKLRQDSADNFVRSTLALRLRATKGS